MTPPPEPIPAEPGENWEHFEVYQAVKGSLNALPYSFTTDLNITGVAATDLFSFNSSLGASIETQMVKSLNELRASWDPKQQYALYHFVRQSQRFPDVILRNSSNPQDIVMGIELKGWYVLAKEREPSFRYRVTPNVCAQADLLVVFPWALSSVVSGSPQLFQPYVVSARYAAAYRNWHWQYQRRQYQRSASSDSSITLSTVAEHYPKKSDPIADMPKSDNGGNFGRFARTGLMDSYREALYREELSGIPLAAWQRFLSLFSEDQAEDAIIRELDRMATEHTRGKTRLSEAAVSGIKDRLAEIVALLEGT